MSYRPPTPSGLKPKDLIGVPWRLAFALQADGWYLRSDIIWYKPNCQPESVKDRPTRCHEYVFLFSKSEKYYYDYEAVMEPANGSGKLKNKDLSGALIRNLSKRRISPSLPRSSWSHVYLPEAEKEDLYWTHSLAQAPSGKYVCDLAVISPA